jgi:hypothetical protein
VERGVERGVELVVNDFNFRFQNEIHEMIPRRSYGWMAR